MSAPADPIAIALLVTRVFDALHIRHTIGGSIASSFAGEPRSTVDIDIVAAIDEGHVADLVAALSDDSMWTTDRWSAPSEPMVLGAGARASARRHPAAEAAVVQGRRRIVGPTVARRDRDYQDSGSAP